MISPTTPPLNIAEVPRIDPGVPVGRALELFLETTNSPHTRRAYRRNIRNFLQLLGVETLGEIEVGHLVAYRAFVLAADNYATASQSQALVAVRSFLFWAAALDGVKFRMEQLNGLMKVPSSTVLNPYQVLTPTEIGRFLDAARASGQRDFAIALVSLGAGLRVSEVTHLSCKDLKEDADGGAYLHVRRGKGRKDRLVPIHEEVAQAIHTYLLSTKRKVGDDSTLFLAEDTRADSRDSKPMTTRAVGYLVKKFCEAASVAKRISPHSLRHTYAIACLRNGKDLVAVSKLLGHSMLATTQRYVNHLEILELRNVVPGFLVGKTG